MTRTTPSQLGDRMTKSMLSRWSGSVIPKTREQQDRSTAIRTATPGWAGIDGPAGTDMLWRSARASPAKITKPTVPPSVISPTTSWASVSRPWRDVAGGRADDAHHQPTAQAHDEEPRDPAGGEDARDPADPVGHGPADRVVGRRSPVVGRSGTTGSFAPRIASTTATATPARPITTSTMFDVRISSSLSGGER